MDDVERMAALLRMIAPEPTQKPLFDILSAILTLSEAEYDRGFAAGVEAGKPW